LKNIKPMDTLSPLKPQWWLLQFVHIGEVLVSCVILLGYITFT
jgi:uncharacterized membrane protein YphA (DoxX/SURF4 family)